MLRERHRFLDCNRCTTRPAQYSHQKLPLIFCKNKSANTDLTTVLATIELKFIDTTLAYCSSNEYYIYSCSAELAYFP